MTRRDAYYDDGDKRREKNVAFCSADCDETSSRLRNTQTSVIVVTKIISTKSTEKCVRVCECARASVCVRLAVYVYIYNDDVDGDANSAAALCVYTLKYIHTLTHTNAYNSAKRNTKYIELSLLPALQQHQQQQQRRLQRHEHATNILPNCCCLARHRTPRIPLLHFFYRLAKRHC